MGRTRRHHFDENLILTRIFQLARERQNTAHSELRKLARTATMYRGDSWREDFNDVTYNHQRGMGGWVRYDLSKLLNEPEESLTRSRRVLARSFLLGLEQRGLVQMAGRRATELRLTTDGKACLKGKK